MSGVLLAIADTAGWCVVALALWVVIAWAVRGAGWLADVISGRPMSDYDLLVAWKRGELVFVPDDEHLSCYAMRSRSGELIRCLGWHCPSCGRPCSDQGCFACRAS